MNAPMLEVSGLSVAYRQGERWLEALADVSLAIQPGQRYGLVGESGSGKSTLALAVMRHLSANASVTQGRILLDGGDVGALTREGLADLWRRNVKLVPQNPLTALNPSMRIGDQLAEGQGGAAAQRVPDLLASVRIADPARVAASYPHQLSGGMQQRVIIAMALAAEPKLLVLDEPTTNLDVTTEAAILDLVRELVAGRNMAVLFISHSLAVVASLCDRVGVLYAGELVEEADAAELFTSPLHPYTSGLLNSLPRLSQRRAGGELRPIPGSIPQPGEREDGCVFAGRCPVAEIRCHQAKPLSEAPAGATRQVRCHRWEEIASGLPVWPQPEVAAGDAREHNRSKGDALVVDQMSKAFVMGQSLGQLLRRTPATKVQAVDDASLTAVQSRTLGIVGESGSGKTTLARCVIGLVERDSGEVTLLGAPLAGSLARRDRTLLRRLQMVFQNPDEALNPYRTVGETLRRPLLRLAKVEPDEVEARVEDLLASVRLSPDYAGRLPGQLSGGEKQRVAIARVFAAEPDLVIFDESVSSLDVSVQASILNLINDLQCQRATTYLFISHDLAVVGYLADDVVVMYQGQIVESGSVEAIFAAPWHPYTEALVAATPAVEQIGGKGRIHLENDLPVPAILPGGCRFHNRCHRSLGDICREVEPPWQEGDGGHRIRCHITLSQLEHLQA